MRTTRLLLQVLSWFLGQPFASLLQCCINLTKNYRQSMSRKSLKRVHHFNLNGGRGLLLGDFIVSCILFFINVSYSICKNVIIVFKSKFLATWRHRRRLTIWRGGWVLSPSLVRKNVFQKFAVCKFSIFFFLLF